MLPSSSLVRNRYRLLGLTAALLGCIGISWALLGPNNKPKSATEYRYMHCKTCRAERAYDQRFAELRCLKCSPQKDGTFIPTVASIRSAGGGPWKWFSVAVALEVILYMGLVVYLVSPRSAVMEERFLYCNCPSCKWRLRFRERSAGKDGACPRCKRTFRFPAPEQADKHEHPESQKQPETSPH